MKEQERRRNAEPLSMVRIHQVDRDLDLHETPSGPPDVLTEEEAERLTTDISHKLGIIADNTEAVMPLIREAIERKAYEALGYPSHGAYVAERFGDTLTRLEVAQRAGVDAHGPYFDLELQGRDRHLFLFKFTKASGEMEPEYANRLWSAHDGREIWVHSDSSPISSGPPVMDTLRVHYLSPTASSEAELHLWQQSSDFATTFRGTPTADRWMHFEARIYTELPYRFKFKDVGLQRIWEDDEAERNVFLRDGVAWTVDGDGSQRRLGANGAWTFEGDHELFGDLPRADKEVIVEIASVAPDSALPAPIALDVWVNRARARTLTALPAGPDGRWTFTTYPEVVTSFRFHSGAHQESADRHTLKVSAAEAGVTRRFIVLGRAEPLASPPVPDLFSDPPFRIERPGAWIADDQVRFAVHCPLAATAEVVGEWTGWQAAPVAMRSTRDATYWWTQVPVATIAGAVGRPDVHGVLYKFVLNQVRLVQDPAADWVENSDPSRASRLVDHRRYAWRSNGWRRPGWEYLTIYQLHPSRFSRRGGASGLAAVTRELDRSPTVTSAGSTRPRSCSCRSANSPGTTAGATTRRSSTRSSRRTAGRMR